MMLIAMLLAAAQDQGTTVRQERLSVEDVLGGRVRPSDAETEALNEQRRHHRAIERELERMRKERSVWTLPSRPQRARPLRTLPPSANRY